MCQCCGRPEDLHVHHVLPVNQFPELSFEVDNGFTMCKGCHKEYHHEYGVKSECNEKTLKDFADMHRCIVEEYTQEINWDYGLINKPTHQKTKEDFFIWSMSILKRVNCKYYGLIENIFNFYVTHENIVSGTYLELFWQDFLHNNYDGVVSWNSLDTLMLECKEPFLLIHNENKSILGIYNEIYFGLDDYFIQLVDINKSQILTDKEANDLAKGKYDFVTLSDIKKKQFDKSDKLAEYQAERILNRYRKQNHVHIS